MTDCETAISNVEISQTDLKSETYNKFNKQKRKKHKHKLAEAENMPQTIIMETNKALNCIVQHESMRNKLPRSGNENSRKKKVTVYEIIESATAEKSDNNVNSNKVHKRKRKHKLNNDENVSDCRILEMDIQDLENNTSIEIQKELNQHRKKHKHKSLGEMENVSNYRIKESGKAENNRILDELYKRKRHQKQTEFDNMSDYLSTDLNVVELSQNNFNGAIFSGVHKQKRKKRHKLVAAENLPKTADMESNPISNNTAYHEGAEESIIKNLDGQSVSKLSRKNNRHFETKAENHKKKKYKSTINTNEFDCKIVEPAATEKSDIYVNSNKFHKKKRKHKATDDQNVSECRIAETAMQELENDTNIEFLKGLRRQKRKKDKHKLLGEMENVFNYQESATDESGRNRILSVFEVHNREDKHKQIEVDKISDCKTSELNAIEINQNDLNSENVNRFHKEKKMKHKHKLQDEMENISYCKTAELDAVEINRNDLNSENVCGFHKEKKKKHKRKLLDKMEKISDCKTAESDAIEINQNDLNSENVRGFHKEKKNKHKLKLLDEMENRSDCKTAESDAIEINQNDLNNESVRGFHKEKKNKHKRKLLDKMEKISDCKTAESDAIEINRNDLNSENVRGFHKEKKNKRKHKLLDEIENRSDCKTAESDAIEINENDLNNENVRGFHKEKKNKHKRKLLDEMEKISDCKTAESDVIEINQNDLNCENVNRFHKEKKKKRKHKLLDEIENTSDCKTAESDAIEINENDLNNENVCGFHKEKKNKHKRKLLDEMENRSDCKTAESDAIEINQNDLNNENVHGFHKEKKNKHKHKLLDEMENRSDCKTAESDVIEVNQNDLNSENVNRFHKEKKKKRKHKLLDETESRSDCKTAESDATEINRNDLSNGTFNGLHKAKRRKHRHNSAKVENMPKTVIESNNVRCHERTKENREKSIVQNSVADILPRLNKEHVESRIEMLSNNLQEKEKNVSCKGTEKNYQEFEDAYMSFDLCINDISEEPVPFLVPLLHEGERVASITAERRAYLEKNGVTVHTGKWTKTEDDILTRNFQQFCLEFRINNPFQLLGINQNKKDAEIIKFKRAKHFLVRLGKDLNNRPLRSIYMRARKLLTPLKNKKKLSAEETADLKHAHQLVGNKWTRISDMLSRSDSTCHTAFRWHKSDINKGKWTPEEESNLIKAIKTVSGAEDISANNLKNISWKAVEKYVPTRNEFQCQKYWAGHLAWDTSVTERKCWEKYHYGKLIYLLKEKYCFNSECEIDWRELHKHFNDVAASYIYLHKKWFYLKSKLPKGFDLSYSKQLDAFKKMYEEEYKIFADEKL